MPVTTLTSVPSARWKRPTTSICQSSIERDSLPTLVVGTGALARRRFEQAVTDQGPIDRRASWHRSEALLARWVRMIVVPISGDRDATRPPWPR